MTHMKLSQQKAEKTYMGLKYLRSCTNLSNMSVAEMYVRSLACLKRKYMYLLKSPIRKS